MTVLIAPTLPIGEAPLPFGWESTARRWNDEPTAEQVAEQGYRAFAACSFLDDPDTMYPDHDDAGAIAEAKRVCASCPLAVIAACKKDADEFDSFAVLYGTTPADRRAERARIRSARWREAQTQDTLSA